MPAYPLTSVRREYVLAVLTKRAGRFEVISEKSVGHEWAPVTRLVFDRELPDIGSSVVVKTRRVDGEGHGGPAYLRREAAGLRTAASSGVTARLIHVDDDAGITVQGDLGDWPSLQDLLLADDREAATAGMVAMGAAVGRLHASTFDRREGHRRTLEAFDADVDTGLIYLFDDHWERIERACAELGFPSARRARDEVTGLLERVADPGPFGALIHVDLNPTNVLITDAGARLVDFEGCRFGHIGIDACFLHYPFPHHSKPWGLLPAEVVEAADSAYRAVLAPGGDVVGSSGGDLVLANYDRMLADGAAIPLIGRIARLSMVAEPDQPPEIGWRRRGQIVQQIETYTRLADLVSDLTSFVGWLRELAAAMVARWPDAIDPPAPLFPVYVG